MPETTSSLTWCNRYHPRGRPGTSLTLILPPSSRSRGRRATTRGYCSICLGFSWGKARNWKRWSMSWVIRRKDRWRANSYPSHLGENTVTCRTNGSVRTVGRQTRSKQTTPYRAPRRSVPSITSNAATLASRTPSTEVCSSVRDNLVRREKRVSKIIICK